MIGLSISQVYIRDLSKEAELNEDSSLTYSHTHI